MGFRAGAATRNPFFMVLHRPEYMGEYWRISEDLLCRSVMHLHHRLCLTRQAEGVRFELYVRPDDVKAALSALARAGYKTELTFSHWLAKATWGGDVVDLIFRAGNGLCEVDDSWFERARDEELLGLPVKLCAPEEMIWMKAYIMERERFDGADIAHVLRCCAAEIDWPHLVRRFGPDWRVLLSHLILFGYIYPGQRERIPAAIMEDLITRLRGEANTAGPEWLCRGTLLSRQQYLLDVQEWGLCDARLDGRVQMNEKNIADWTDAIGKQE